MAKFCGGINLGAGLKVIDGIICDSGATRLTSPRL